MNKVVTIGAIGYSAETFFAALQAAGVDTLVDVRRRRAVRGRDYVFANSQRLQAGLAERGIRYLHRLDLAPPADIRRRQTDADKAAGVAKRQRVEISPIFVEAYEREVLGNFDPRSLWNELPGDAAVIALLCVERLPSACHRSLLAKRLGREWNVEVEHLIP